MSAVLRGVVFWNCGDEVAASANLADGARSDLERVRKVMRRLAQKQSGVELGRKQERARVSQGGDGSAGKINRDGKVRDQEKRNKIDSYIERNLQYDSFNDNRDL